MSNSRERRTLPRYLCNKQFGDTQVTINKQLFTLLSINFNHKGIALYSTKMLPQGEACMVSFQAEYENKFFKIVKLKALIRHRQETEVGHQYGIQFNCDINTEKKVVSQLIALENILAENANDEDRWGLLNN